MRTMVDDANECERQDPFHPNRGSGCCQENFGICAEDVVAALRKIKAYSSVVCHMECAILKQIDSG